MDLAGMIDEVRERLGETDGLDDFWTDDEITRAINEAIVRFCYEDQWPFLLTEWDSSITVDEDELDLPQSVSLTRVFNLAINGDTLATPRMLTRVSPQEGFRLRHMYSNMSGCPRWYYITRTDLSTSSAPPITYTAKLIPTSDGDYDVEAQYMAVPDELATDTDEPMVPPEYQEAIVAWATGKLFLKELGISQKSQEQFQIYSKVLAQAIQDLKAFDLDETVAWGRNEPLRGYWAQEFDPRFRVPPTLGS